MREWILICKKNILSLILFVHFLLVAWAVNAQHYNYKQYDIKDGLAGSTVYQIHQDKEGFLWFATETGLSRFDGTRFKNYSIKDGLPDNSIIRVFEDSRGRIWLLPFKNAICYYYKGKIYNQQNDSILKHIKLGEYVIGIGENKYGDLLFSDSRQLYLIDTSCTVKLINHDQFPNKAISKLAAANSGHFNICFSYNLYTTDTKTFKFRESLQAIKGGAEHIIINDRMTCWLESNTVLHIRSAYYGLDYYQKVPAPNTIFAISDSVICLNTINGTLFYNILSRRIEKQFLTNKNISHFIADKEGGYWFATLNRGVFHLSSPNFKTITQEINGSQSLGVYDLKIHKGHILAGSDMGYLQKIKEDQHEPISINKQITGQNASPVATITTRKDLLVAGCGLYICLKRPGSKFIFDQGYSANKQILFKNDHELIIAGSNALYTVPTTNLKQHNILWKGRTTCLFHRNDSTWFGTLEGLYLLKPDTTVVYLGNTNPIFKNRIVAIREGMDGTIWVATGGAGIVGLQNNTMAWHFNHAQGLNSDIVRCLAIDTSYIWAGTDKGLNKIDIRSKPISITRYSSSDGLNLDIINAILIHGNTVYAGTPEGIIYFDKTESLTSSVCDLKLLGIAINEKETLPANRYDLHYSNNSIRFEYVAISMKSAGNIVYSYRLHGLDSAWKSTTQTTLELISLPPGAYTLELLATNKFGIKSKPYTVQLYIQKPFWQTGWFIPLCILASTLITWLIVTQRNRVARNKENAKRQIEQQLLELEQKALRAQMNPHFIFNCLNSIQGFILDKDIITANKFLSQFASLIRQTLDNSFQSFMSLADEINYLTTYLHLEQMRSGHSFQYAIHTDSNLVPATILIPGMVLQPYVENAVQHGMQRSGENGYIDISFSIGDNQLICSIKDNGIGRQMALALKINQPAVYRSRGLQLTQERIDLINKNLDDKKITIEIIDHRNGDYSKGTEVIVRFPVFNIYTYSHKQHSY